MRRAAALLVLLCALMAPASPAGAQSSPFGPLPPAATPTPEPVPTPEAVADQSSVGRGLLLGIGGVVLLLFVAIGTFIARDARRNLTDEDRRSLERSEHPSQPAAERRQGERAKQRHRAKTRAQKKARKQQRR